MAVDGATGGVARVMRQAVRQGLCDSTALGRCNGQGGEGNTTAGQADVRAQVLCGQACDDRDIWVGEWILGGEDEILVFMVKK